MLRAFALLVFLALAPAVLADDQRSPDVPAPSEVFYQQRFCAGMDVSIRLGRQLRADCLSDTHAIEIEWYDEWRPGLAQMLVNSATSGLRPGIILVCRSDQANCQRESGRLRATLTHHAVSATVWDCLPIHRTLADCVRTEL